MIGHSAELLLEAIRRAVSCRRLYSDDNHLTRSAEAALAEVADRLVGSARRTVLSIVGDTLYLDSKPLPLMSVTFNTVARDLAAAGIESIAFRSPVSVDDSRELNALVCGAGDGPADGSSIVVNDDPMRIDHAPQGGTEQARGAYTASLSALRGVGVSLRKGTGIELTRVNGAVRSLLDHLVAQPGAAFLLSTVKSHHEYTFYHSVNTSILALAFGRRIGLGDDDLGVLGLGAILHDIGKIGVPAAILRKPSRLTAGEWDVIRRHPQLGAEAILAAATPGQEAAAVVAFQHHARFDGAGYPDVGGSGLHFFSRLVAVVDAYDAITTRRSYRRAESPVRALSTLLHGAGSSHDPDFVHAFIQMMGIYPPGTLLQLRGGSVAMITHPAEDGAGPPFGVLVADETGDPTPDLDPIAITPDLVVDHLSPQIVGVDPMEILDRLTAHELMAAS